MKVGKSPFLSLRDTRNSPTTTMAIKRKPSNIWASKPLEGRGGQRSMSWHYMDQKLLIREGQDIRVSRGGWLTEFVMRLTQISNRQAAVGQVMKHLMTGSALS